jgi:tRNA-2-methylthio-N6-dimethylallyladenosine synthase
VRRLREAVPGLSLTTDLIVGFPGETEEDFDATLSLVEEVGYDAAFTFVYSPRPGTPAARLPGRLPEDVAERRMARLVELVQTTAARRNAALVGAEVEVLVEGRSRHDPAALMGRTRTFKTVNLRRDEQTGTARAGDGPPSAAEHEGGGGLPRPGDLVLVLVEAATSTSLQGRLVA